MQKEGNKLHKNIGEGGKPVFAVGGTVSGYASMGSMESIGGPAENGGRRNSTVWCRPCVIVDGEESSVAEVSGSRRENLFKSNFAKELEERDKVFSIDLHNPKLDYVTNSHNISSENSSTKTNIMCIHGSLHGCSLCESPKSVRQSLEEEPEIDFLSLKLENKRLKRQIKKLSKEDEKYNKLQNEIDHLTWQLSKMDQSRKVYESATQQLGSFLELVSTKLTTSSPNSRSETSSDLGMSHRTTYSQNKSETNSDLGPQSDSTNARRWRSVPRTSDISVRRKYSEESFMYNKGNSTRKKSDPQSMTVSQPAGVESNVTYPDEDDEGVTLPNQGQLFRLHGGSTRGPWSGRPTKDEKCEHIQCTCDNEVDKTIEINHDFSQNPKEEANSVNTLGRIKRFFRKEKSMETKEQSKRKDQKHYPRGSIQNKTPSINGFYGIWSLRNY